MANVFALFTVLIVIVGAWMLVALIVKGVTKGKKIGPPRWLVWIVAAPFILTLIVLVIGGTRSAITPTSPTASDSSSQTAWVKPDMPVTLNADFTWYSQEPVFRPVTGDPSKDWGVNDPIIASTDPEDYHRMTTGQPLLGKQVLLQRDGTWKTTENP
jgi:hypothetical protein